MTLPAGVLGSPDTNATWRGYSCRLSQHEYPRHVAFVAELPKTPAGKVNRKTLREAETAAPSPAD